MEFEAAVVMQYHAAEWSREEGGSNLALIRDGASLI